jgi:hypothetical protein
VFGIFLPGDATAGRRDCTYDAIEPPTDMPPDVTVCVSTGRHSDVTLLPGRTEGAAERPAILRAA